MTEETPVTFDTEVYERLMRARAASVGSADELRWMKLMDLMNVLGTANINAVLAVDELRKSGASRGVRHIPNALKYAVAARDDAQLALAVLQRALRDGVL